MSSYDEGTPAARLGAAILAAIAALFTIVGIISGVTTVDGGQVAVVRNGGPLDSRDVRGVINPSAGPTWTGWFSDAHKYPSTSRTYTITADGKRGERAGVDIVNVPSKDGVSIGVEGTVYFTLNADHKALTEFDNRYGTRTFTGLDKEDRHAWDGTDGWNSFLDQIIRPVIESDLRQQMARYRCADLVSSCGLVQNTTGPGSAAPGGAIQALQEGVNTSLAANVKATLGGDFLTGVAFNLTRVTLPEQVQAAVDGAQAAFADVSKSRAKVEQAKADAAANRIKQQGYNACPACAKIDIMKAIPDSITTYAPGSDVAVTGK